MTLKIKEIWKLFPLLEKEVEKANMGKDYTDIKFKNGSTLSIAAALDSDRGLRKHSCLVDETRKKVNIWKHIFIKLSIR